MTPRLSLLIGSTNTIDLVGLHNEVDDSYPTDATVSAALLDPTGTPVTGATAVNMQRTGSTTGAATLYRGVLPHTLALTPGTYIARITAVDPDATNGGTRTFDLECVAQRG